VRAYLAFGEAGGISERYKCRVRSPWWSVPLPKHGAPSAFMTYCSSEHPRVVLNEVGAFHTNTVHGLTATGELNAAEIAARFLNSLTLLSVELVGRSYGGGVLKLEPTEAEAALLPTVGQRLAPRLREIDDLLRRGSLDQVLRLIDPLVLGSEGLGLEDAQIARLRAGGEKLRSRRRARGKAPQPEQLTL
jgi:adenine-specific DNA-methyltransferase